MTRLTYLQHTANQSSYTVNLILPHAVYRAACKHFFNDYTGCAWNLQPHMQNVDNGCCDTGYQTWITSVTTDWHSFAPTSRLGTGDSTFSYCCS